VTRVEKLRRMGACSEACEWLALVNGRTAARIWKECERGDWMLWLLGRLAGPVHSVSRRKLVLCALGCAELAFPLVKVAALLAELRDAAALLRRYAESEAAAPAAADAELDRARDALWAVRRKAAADAAAAAAADAAAAAAAYAVAAAAAYAVVAAAAAADAAAVAADAAARSEMRLKCAAVVRRHFPKPPVLP
jgi:hypothetical protein